MLTPFSLRRAAISRVAVGDAAVANAVAHCRRLVAEGRSLLVFPEGSRAVSGLLQPFRNVAFKLALECGRPVVPVVIHSTLPFMAKVPGSVFPHGRNRYRIRFLAPEPISAGDTPESLSDRVHRRMSAELRQLDVGTPWERPNPRKP